MDKRVQKTCSQDKEVSERDKSVCHEIESAKRYQELMDMLGKKSPETDYIQRVEVFKKVPALTSKLLCLKNA